MLAVPRTSRALLTALVAAAAVLTGCLIDAGDSKAARGMELAIQDDAVFVNGAYKRVSGDKAFAYTRALGITRQRVNIQWAYAMPEAQFNARNKPAAVNYNFVGYDALIDQAAANGVRIHLSLTGPAPRWANAKRFVPKRALVQAERHGVRQVRHAGGRALQGPRGPLQHLERAQLEDMARPACVRSRALPPALPCGLQRDQGRRPGRQGPDRRDGARSRAAGYSTSPLAFLRGVTCVNTKYKRTRSCPKLKADGYAHHPYDFGHAPNYQYPGADNVTIGTLSRLTKALDKLSRAGVLRMNGGGKMPLYLTEYGYFNSGHRALSKKLRSRYLKQAYSIALKNSRVKSQLQYLLVSPPRTQRASFFDLGLVSTSGKRNVSYTALQSWYRANRGKVKRPGAAITLPSAQPNPVG